MKKCTGNNTQDWGFDAIFDVKCPNCGYSVEFFKDDIKRNCPHCQESVLNNRKDFGCRQWCDHQNARHGYTVCPKFKRSKDRFYGHNI